MHHKYTSPELSQMYVGNCVYLITSSSLEKNASHKWLQHVMDPVSEIHHISHCKIQMLFTEFTILNIAAPLLNLEREKVV